MATSIQMRRDNVSEGRATIVEKDKVPKIASHFESLVDKAKGSGAPHEGGNEKATITEEVHKDLPTRQSEDHVVRVGENQVHKPNQEEGGRKEDEYVKGSKEGGDKQESHERNQEVQGKIGQEKEEGGGKGEVKGSQEGGDKQGSNERNQEVQGKYSEEKHGLPVEEISKYRQTAQQNSMDNMKGAMKKYELSKEWASQGLGDTAEYLKEKGGETMEALKQGMQTGDVTETEDENRGDEGRDRGGVARVVLHAIGETIFEIGQITKVMIAGEAHPRKHT